MNHFKRVYAHKHLQKPFYWGGGIGVLCFKTVPFSELSWECFILLLYMLCLMQKAMGQIKSALENKVVYSFVP